MSDREIMDAKFGKLLLKTKKELMSKEELREFMNSRLDSILNAPLEPRDNSSWEDLLKQEGFFEMPKIKKQELPDARKHQIISFIKSGIRILGYAFLPFNLVIATIILIFSEIVGIIEELV
jgi:aspartate/tyrosine/aromatic aminotransferase